MCGVCVMSGAGCGFCVGFVLGAPPVLVDFGKLVDVSGCVVIPDVRGEALEVPELGVGPVELGGNVMEVVGAGVKAAAGGEIAQIGCGWRGAAGSGLVHWRCVLPEGK